MNKFFKFSAVLAIGLVFIGCGGKQLQTGAYPKPDSSATNEFIIYAKAPDRGFMTSNATYLNETIVYTLQVAAEQTKVKGYEYFAIQKPAELSNTDGIMVNTAKEYIDKCANNNVLKGMVVLTNPCRVAVGGLEAPKGGKLEIIVLSAQDPAVITYNASEVTNVIKAAGFDITPSN